MEKVEFRLMLVQCSKPKQLGLTLLSASEPISNPAHLRSELVSASTENFVQYLRKIFLTESNFQYSLLELTEALTVMDPHFIS